MLLRSLAVPAFAQLTLEVMGPGSRFAWPGRRSAPHRQLDHIISMPDAALENGVLKFEFKAAGGPDTALRRKRAAEHGATIGQFSTFEAPRDQLGNRQHGIQCALLVQLALAADPGKRT